MNSRKALKIFFNFTTKMLEILENGRHFCNENAFVPTKRKLKKKYENLKMKIHKISKFLPNFQKNIP